jgi:hypothetical protein
VWNPLAKGDVGARAVDYGRLPFALVMLLVSLAQVLLLAGGFIIAPLVSSAPQLRSVPHKTRVLLFFGALGLAFITVEIALLQKYTVFVGGPVYAMAVTLFGILVFSGIGSFLSQHLIERLTRPLTVMLLALAGAIVFETLFANHVVPRLMFLPHATRCAVTVLALAPLALLMGMPFPTGIRAAQQLGPVIIPWSWGVNAVTTTMGSILCVLVNMNWGFTPSLLGAAILYLAAAALRIGRLDGGQGELARAEMRPV